MAINSLVDRAARAHKRCKPAARGTYEEARGSKPIGSVHCPDHIEYGPRAYALKCTGDCLSPEIDDGATVICDPDQRATPGDFVAIWFKGGADTPHIKRLAMALPPDGVLDLESSDIEFILVVDMLNPPKRLTCPASRIEAVHKVIFHFPETGVSHG
jgi:hypothetical protein